ncbi:MAG: thioredoxin-dependent thiol peroxidase [Marinifilaceae bacterium]|jgi:peroxiredoxin Q/BCP|nr:thioredoxin-dependent thiol peroxidase [Marinifilaceae bacterium]
MTTLKIGDQAPVFEGVDTNGEIIKLSDYQNKKIVLYFYPKDNTPGCTAQACNLNENYDILIKNGFEVIGVSPDSEASHKKFTDKHGLKFRLIADTEKEILAKYGVWGEKKMYGKTYMGVIRTTFIINTDGVIEDIISKVKTKDHTNQIIK